MGLSAILAVKDGNLSVSSFLNFVVVDCLPKNARSEGYLNKISFQ
jgi:hypothetical protein